jgi:hypothetical protein
MNPASKALVCIAVNNTVVIITAAAVLYFSLNNENKYPQTRQYNV